MLCKSNLVLSLSSNKTTLSEVLRHIAKMSGEPRTTVTKMYEPYDIYIGDTAYVDIQGVRTWYYRSKWYNPFWVPNIRSYDQWEAMLQQYKTYIINSPALLLDLKELQGKRLGCWCNSLKGPDCERGPCHGQILIELIDTYHSPF